MTKKRTDNDKEKELARTLFLAGCDQSEIAEKVGKTRQTISRWCTEGKWQEVRAAKNITRPELVNKLLFTINTLIDQVNDSGDATLMLSLGDRLAKLSAVVEKLDKKANVVDAIEVFIAFSKWMEYRSATDPDLTPQLIKTINRYQDKFVSELMNASLAGK